MWIDASESIVTKITFLPFYDFKLALGKSESRPTKEARQQPHFKSPSQRTERQEFYVERTHEIFQSRLLRLSTFHLYRISQSVAEHNLALLLLLEIVLASSSVELTWVEKSLTIFSRYRAESYM